MPLKRLYKELASVLVVWAVVLAVASCALEQKAPESKLERGLLGRWRQIAGQTTLEFFREGTVIIVDSEGATTNYFEFVDEQNMKIEPKFRTRQLKSGSRMWRVAVRDNLLTVVEGAQVTSFERQR